MVKIKIIINIGIVFYKAPKLQTKLRAALRAAQAAGI